MFRVDKSGRIVVNSANVIQDRSGKVFIDRDAELFRYVLQFLRDGRRVVLPDDVSLLKQILREAEFFGLMELQALIAENIAAARQAELQPNPQAVQQQDALEEMIEVMKKVSHQLNLNSLTSIRR
uniref:Potassium channel tetramerisation-type BTB domain-containing protein n=1 Tax=Acrobeloides nanus TaxID=290746 RepID=A0A914D888_9BILA